MATNQSIINALANGEVVSTDAGCKTVMVPVQQCNTEEASVLRVAAPTQAVVISTSSAAVGQDNCYEFCFKNSTGADQNIIFASWATPGNYLAMPSTFGPSAVDFAAFTEDCNDVFLANAGALKLFNFGLSVTPLLICKMCVSSTDASVGTQKVETGTINRQFKEVGYKKCPPLCDECSNNNNSLFVRCFRFTPPVMLQGMNFIKYKVKNGVEVSIQLEVCGTGDGIGYTAVGQ